VPESASLVSVNPRLINSLIHQASCISTSLSVENNAEVLKRQACYLPLSSETSLPLIGPHTYYKELYLATGHSFWGILNAPITGKLISELLILNSVQSLDAEAYKYFLP
jgi:glycine/D-amino acid oxidase-like deaminating enzyme